MTARTSTDGHKNFNPRTHVGCDSVDRVDDPLRGISIHAPTWGATLPDFDLGDHGDISIHAPTWGATVVGGQVAFKERDFNPRTHVGCDECVRPKSCCSAYFNPRTHVGCDQAAGREDSGVYISIHAPTWGATRTDYTNVQTLKISIHAPTWGATTSQLIVAVRPQFQSTHPRGVRLC